MKMIRENTTHRFILFVVIAAISCCLPLVSGCTPEQEAEAKEFWLGIPNKTPPKDTFLADSDNDPPKVREYKRQARGARENLYKDMSHQRSMKMFAEKADSVDTNNIRDILYSQATAHRVDNQFRENPELRRPPPQRRYTPMDFEQSASGDMYRAGKALGELGAEISRQDAIRAERRAIDEARQALNSYVIQMETAKLALVRQR